MEPGIIAVIIAGAVLVLNLLVYFGSGTRNIAGDIQKVHDTLVSKIDAERRDFGESLAAVRQKVTDVELESAKSYVRRESFHQAMNQIHDQLQSADEASELRSQRLEEKIDRLSDRFRGPHSGPAE